jgi:hypothetical protein
MPPFRRAPCAPGARTRALRRSPRFALRGLPLVFLTLALLFAQGNRVLHELLVRHVVCEHGDLIHQEGPRAPTAPTAPIAPAAPTATSDDHDAALAQGHDPSEHDHCDAKSVLHRLAQVGPCVAPASLLHLAPPSLSGEHRAFPPIALLHLAPKSSPPA